MLKFSRRLLWNAVLASLSIAIYFLYFRGLYVDELRGFFSLDPEWYGVHVAFLGLVMLMMAFDYFLDHTIGRPR